MSHLDKDGSPESPEREDKISTHTESDYDSGAEKDNDSFEDAIDAVSVRSLTRRAASTTKDPPLEDTNNVDNNGNATDAVKDAVEDAPQPVDVDQGTEVHEEQSQPHSRRTSHTSSLDNVNLNDDVPRPTNESNGSPNATQTGKTLSLSSLTSALPSMPWSPPSVSPSRSPGPSIPSVPPGVIPVSTSTTNDSQPPPPPPPSRKLTSPFSWLSRSSSSKDKDSATSPPVQATGRRNTSSSIATLMSNPEMMLSKLEETNESDPTTGTNSARSSLKTRFKALRMQQEAGILNLPADTDKGMDGKKNEEVQEPLASPLALSPTSNDLRPGTASGVSAGPSTLPDAQVDWDLWQSVVYEGPAAVARSSADDLNRAIATGIPSAIRGVIWQVLAQSKSDELERMYGDLVARGTDKEQKRHSNSTTASSASNSNANSQTTEQPASSASSVHSDQSAGNLNASPPSEKSNESAAKLQAAAAERKHREKIETAALQKLEKMIRRDLGARTSYSKYAASAGLQEGLFGVCKAYALYDEAVGYAQGMNFLIMPILFNMPEQEAFCLLVRLMNQYNLRDLFVQDMPGLHLRLYQFERLLEDVEPALYCHLHRRNISPHLYATQWFLTLFAYRFPLQLVLRIYDLILSEGLSAILRFGIVLMQKNASTLLGLSDMQQLTTYLKDKLFDVYIDKDPSQGSLLESGFFGSSSSSIDKEVYRADQLVRDAAEVKISPEVLKLYTTEWEDKVKLEKERETEVQDLRLANQKFAIQVRKLEERVEACDREQATLATDLVHTKVENEELRDENESLKGQVRELRVVIDKQPLEIEEAWKLERDDLMKRNEHVHVENTKLEQELAELEDELVQTKMQYAEINSQHETLNRKWSELKRQFA